ncbi:hypothetical protein QP185_17865 [Sphingomonas aerolata]|uniref:hypothetical protein n=1 Tax=Sphingomonas aerolata TaxID=185951 RepID=UPI002FE2EEE6
MTYGQHGGASRSIEDPHHTIAASSKDQNCIAAATLVQTGWGEREGQAPRCLDAEKPLGTIMADGNEHAAVAAFLSTFNGSNTTGGGGEVEEPLKTARAGGQHHSVVAAHMAQFNSNPDGSVNAGHDMRDLVSTIATRGPHQGVIETTLVEEGDLPPEMLDRAVLTAAFLVKYYGEGGQSQAANRPLDVVTTKARYAVVTVTIDAVTYVIVDIGLRMLKPRELARAQGFPEGYVLDPIVRKMLRGKWVEARLTIAEQISAIGNSASARPSLEHWSLRTNRDRSYEARRMTRPQRPLPSEEGDGTDLRHLWPFMALANPERAGNTGENSGTLHRSCTGAALSAGCAA